ncbi:MAG: hypothetical protein ACKOFP_08080, partial [Actinomycetota bacterium]
MRSRLTPRGVGVVVTALALVALGFVLGYPELLGLAAGALVLIVVSFFLVSGGRPGGGGCSGPPPGARGAARTPRLGLLPA